jgi:hypothetical protein
MNGPFSIEALGDCVPLILYPMTRPQHFTQYPHDMGNKMYYNITVRLIRSISVHVGSEVLIAVVMNEEYHLLGYNAL